MGKGTGIKRFLAGPRPQPSAISDITYSQARINIMIDIVAC